MAFSLSSSVMQVNLKCMSLLDHELGGGTIGDYGVLMLVKRQLQPQFKLVDIPSRMGRKLLTAAVTLPSLTADAPALQACFATVHLESLSNADLRRSQLAVAERTLSQFHQAVLCGDFNFCSYKNYHPWGPLENNVLSEVK